MDEAMSPSRKSAKPSPENWPLNCTVVEAGAEKSVGAMAADVRSGLDVVLAPGPGDSVVPLESIDRQKPRLLFRETGDYRVASPKLSTKPAPLPALEQMARPLVAAIGLPEFCPCCGGLSPVAGSKLI